MTNDTEFTGPPRAGERYADAVEWEKHMNGDPEFRIPGARFSISDRGHDLVIPHVSSIALLSAETVVALADGCTLRSGASDLSGLTSGEYVRLCDPDGSEILYYHYPEWEEDPILVMGALMNAAAGSRLPKPLTDMEGSCVECGGVVFLEEGVSYHASDDSMDGIDHDLDLDHTALIDLDDQGRAVVS